jgi:glycosyltransferase involved in cell wall biosynthesis
MDAAARPTRVLMLSHYFAQHRGGIEAVAAALARQLAARGFQVSWLATGEVTAPAEGIGYQRVALAASAAAQRVLPIPYPILLPSAWRRIWRESSAHDVILAHDALYMTSILGALAALWQRKPLVVVQHVAFVPFRSAVLRRLMRLANRCIAVPLLRGADQVIFISQLTLQHFVHVGWRHAPVLVFNGVDTEVFRPAGSDAEVQRERRELALPPQGPVVVFVGRFVEKKGLHALEHLARLRGDLLFAFAGHGAHDPSRWRLPNVRVYSELSGASLAALYRAGDVLVLPSVGEGFPLVVQEALACGLAVVCGSDTARADPRAAPLLTGVDVDPSDPAATAARLDAALTRLLQGPATHASRSARAEFARANYSWSAAGERYAQILADAVVTGT